MRLPRVLFTAALTIGAVSNPRAPTPGSTFLLGVPEGELEVSENSSATIPDSFVGRLELRVLRSSQEIPPGKVLVRINGEAANIIMSTRAAESMIVCGLDLYFRPGFLLHSGRNTIEASAQSVYGRSYYATFFLDVRSEPESLREIQREIAVNRQGDSPGDSPPLIHLINPQGAVENVRQLSLRGYVEGGVAPVTVLVQGQAVPLSAGPPYPGCAGYKWRRRRTILGPK